MLKSSGFGKSGEELLLCGVSVSYHLFSTGLHAFGPRKPRRLYDLAVYGSEVGGWIGWVMAGPS